MTILANAVGTVYTLADISTGTVTGTDPVVFRESGLLSALNLPIGLLSPTATVTIQTVGQPNADGVQTITAVVANSVLGNGTVITGTTLGNGSTDFVLNGTVGVLPETLLFTNTPAQQPGVAATISVPGVAANVTYTPACYCAGTLIRTEHGDIPVELLSVGDNVVTHDGGLEPIRWIGTRSYAGRFLAGHHHLLPIRIRAGALGEGLPARDLLVSPKHAMFLDGVLVAAELLVNGSTIVREASVPRVDYFHIELDRHALIWAEGAASETYVDDENRGIFHNAHTYHQLYADDAPASVEYCAPRVTDGFALLAIRRRLNEHQFALAS